MVDVKVLYQKFLSGDSFTDEEVIFGEKHFRSLAAELHKLGPTFRFAENELVRTANSFESMADNRFGYGNRRIVKQTKS